LNNNDRISQTVSPSGLCTLVIKPVRADDQGLYEVEASNDAGQQRAKSQVTVESQFLFWIYYLNSNELKTVVFF